MKVNKKIVEEYAELYSAYPVALNFDGMEIREAIKFLQDLADQYSQYNRLHIEKYYGPEPNSSWLILMGSRDETDAEAAKRIEYDNDFKEQVLQGERKRYEELKKKFEGE